MRPYKAIIETANGKVASLGMATVEVPGLGRSVDAVVIQDAPCLLSAGCLVKEGYELRWGPAGCCLRGPDEAVTKLDVVEGIPVLCGDHEHAAGVRRTSTRRGLRGTAGAGSRRRAGISANVGAVREGVEQAHQQQGHYPWRDDCTVCAESALRSSKHARRLPHAATLAVDIVSMGASGPHVLVGATQQPGWVYAEPLQS